tara:strand:+ start:7464 stop:7655 length:192 start_codon:yes stop_codon:yes gene_type:complete
VITGVFGFSEILNDKLLLSEPAMFVAIIVVLCFPKTLGMPETTPVVEFIDNPEGKFVAEKTTG